MILLLSFSLFFFFNDTATTEIYTLSLHDALPICQHQPEARRHLLGLRLCVAAALVERLGTPLGTWLGRRLGNPKRPDGDAIHRGDRDRRRDRPQDQGPAVAWPGRRRGFGGRSAVTAGAQEDRRGDRGQVPRRGQQGRAGAVRPADR